MSDEFELCSGHSAPACPAVGGGGSTFGPSRHLSFGRALFAGDAAVASVGLLFVDHVQTDAVLQASVM